MISIKSTIVIALSIACLISLSVAKPSTSTATPTSASSLTSGSKVTTNSKVNGTSSSTRARGSRSGHQFDPNYSVWGHPAPNTLSQTGRFDMVPLIPIVLLFGLGLMLIPFLTSFIAHVLYPANVPAGRKRRSADSLFSGSLNEMLINVMKTLESSIEKYAF